MIFCSSHLLPFYCSPTSPLLVVATGSHVPHSYKGGGGGLEQSPLFPVADMQIQQQHL